MTSTEAYGIAQRYTRFSMLNIQFFTVFCVGFVIWIVASPDLHETDAYADVRKMLAVVFSVFSISLMLVTLKLIARANASVALSGALFQNEGDGVETRLFRPVSPMFAFFAMTVAIIVVNYIILIYAVDGGLF